MNVIKRYVLTNLGFNMIVLTSSVFINTHVGTSVLKCASVEVAPVLIYGSPTKTLTTFQNKPMASLSVIEADREEWFLLQQGKCFKTSSYHKELANQVHDDSMVTCPNVSLEFNSFNTMWCMQDNPEQYSC